MTDDEIPEPNVGGQQAFVSDHQLTEMHELLGRVVSRLVTLENHVNQLAQDVARAVEEEERADAEPAPWVWFPPPDFGADAVEAVRIFVAYYNRVYIGRSDGRARRIPDCWERHPGLAMELATLAATWRAANIGKKAQSREAQYWHQQWRPGVIERMIRDWLPQDCLDGTHAADSAVVTS